jgi:hypothetical protein
MTPDALAQTRALGERVEHGSLDEAAALAS